jgi:hypothetical protein
MARVQRDRLFRLGWMLAALSGVVPLIVGLTGFVCFALSVAKPAEAWRTPVGTVPFTLDEVRAFRPALAATWQMVNHVCWANLAVSGITMTCASLVGIRRRERWGFYLVLFILLWVGLNDLYATYACGVALGRPMAAPALPLLLAVLGLVFSAPSVFSADGRRTTASSSLELDKCAE